MTRLTEALRRLFRVQDPGPAPAPGTEAELDGATAVARCEALLGSLPADTPGAALGLALAGHRATCLVTGADSEVVSSAVRAAAGRHAPFVFHLFARAATAHATPVGTGHEALHALADSGAFVLVPQTVQEAVDLTLLARCVAERTLVPGVVVLDREEIARSVGNASLPTEETVREFAGAVADTIPSVTSAQTLLFGEVRRRVPRWIDREHPALLGPSVGTESWAPGAAARRPWFLDELPAALENQRERLTAVTGRPLPDISTFAMNGADIVLVAQGSLVEIASGAARRLAEGRGPRVGVLGVRTLRPFPAAAIAAELGGRRTMVVVLERVDTPLAQAPPLTREIRAALADHADKKGRQPRIVSAIAGLGGLPVRDADLALLCRKLPEHDRDLVYLGVDFLPETETEPKRQAVVDRLRRNRPEVATLGHRAGTSEEDRAEAPAGDPSEERETPLAARRLARSDEHWDSLPRFWDQVGVLARDGRTPGLLPDPHLALGAVPPLSASFRDLSTGEAEWPEFDPARCTGCALCWTLCPDGAIAATALGTRGLLDAGMEIARNRGGSPNVLRSVLGKLGPLVEARLGEEPPPPTFGDAARPAFEELLTQTAPPSDRRNALSSAMDAVLDAIAELPVARTEALFSGAPAAERALVSLAVDPAACKGCGVCVAACEPGALTSKRGTAARRARDARVRALVEELPAPAAATLARVRELAGVGPAGELLMTPAGRSGMTGGDHAEPGSGARLALRLLHAVSVPHLASRQAELLEELDELRSRFAEEIRRGMLDAVPTDDLDAIAQGLRVLGGPDVDVADLVARMEAATETGRVDAERLSRLVEAAKDLADARDACLRTGSPPTPPPIVLAGESLAWAATFPDNPFAGPVVVDVTSRAARVADGLLTGLASETARVAGAIRRAKETLSNPLAGTVAAEAPTWADLDEKERSRVSPVLLVLDAVTWGRQELASLEALFGGDRPVIVVVLSEEGMATPSPAFHALTRRDVFVMQSSIGFPDHLAGGLARALAGGKPAVIHLSAPSPSRNDVAPERLIEVARGLVERRVCPLLVREPAEGGGRGQLELDGNPDREAAGAQPADLAAWEMLCALATPPAGEVPADGEPESPERAEREAALRLQTEADLERRLTGQLLALSGWAPDQGSGG